jgi:hypothetical protein
VKNVRVVDEGISSVTLEWDASGDDGRKGEPYAYLVRTSNRGVVTEDGWNRSRRARFRYLPEQTPGRLRAEVTGLPLTSKGHVTVRAMDDVGNLGAFSVSAPFNTRALETLATNGADSLDGVVKTGTWGLQATTGGGTAFSDSPDGNYADYEDSHLELPPQSIPGKYALLTFRHLCSLEDGYDFGLVEVSVDGGLSWESVLKVTGEAENWKEERVELSPWLKEGPGEVRVRFRLKSDFSENRDGWMVDDVAWLGPVD